MRVNEMLDSMMVNATEAVQRAVEMIRGGVKIDPELDDEEVRAIQSIVTSMIDIPYVPGISLEQRATQVALWINKKK